MTAISAVTARFPRVFAGLILAIAAVLALMPAPEGVSPGALDAAALCLAAIGLWATGVVPEHYTAIAFMVLAALFAVAPLEVIFVGFRSMAWWLVLGGMFIGVAVRRTGLGERVAGSLLRYFGGTYGRTIAGMVLVGTVLAFIVPSTTARVLILVPVVAAMAGRMGFAEGSRGRNGMMLAMVFGTFMPACGILPGNVANMILAGNTEMIYGLVFNYGEYFAIHFPVIGLLRMIAVAVVLSILFRDTPGPAADAAARTPLSAEERRLTLIVGAALVLWMTDFLHGMSPAWVAVGAALLCFVPRLGVLKPSVFKTDFRPAPLFFVAAVLGLGRIVAETGLGALLGDALISAVDLRQGADAYNFAALVGVATFLAPVTTVAGVPAVLGPLASEVSAATGLPLMTVVMTQVIGYSTVVLPHQLPPLIIAMQLGRVRMADGVRASLALTAVILLVLDPLNFIWWRWIGLFG